MTATSDPATAPLRGRRAALAAFLESRPVQGSITGLIVLNAIIFGLETSHSLMETAGPVLHALDAAILVVFVVEIALRLFAHGPRFFRDPWSVFDFLVVGVALVPQAGALGALRALRVLRVLRLVTVMPQLRAVVSGLLRAVPGLSSIAVLLLLTLYVSAVIATNLYGRDAPELFGTLGASFLTLFQIMTLESWGSIMRDVMATHPSAWLFFVLFVLVTSFTVLNLFIAVIVEGMQATAEEEMEKVKQAEMTSLDDLHREVRALTSLVESLRADLKRG